MKVFWSVLVVVGVLAAAAGAVYLWFRVRDKRNALTEDDCCSWDETPECEECCEEEAE